MCEGGTLTNVLLIMADELSTWGLGCYPSGRYPAGTALTPNIDALAARGTRFSAAYTPSPICVPTRAAIATGRYLHEVGYWSSAEAYDGRVPGWGHHLQAAGVPVTSIGKLHYRNQTDPTGFDRQIEPIHIPDGIGWVQGLLRQPLPSYDATAEMSELIGPGETEYTRFDGRVTDEACRWLADAPAQPWCTFVSYLSPHYPLIVPQEYFDRFDPKDFESPAEDVPNHPVLTEIAEFFDHDRYFDPKTRGIGRASYFALCAFLDDQVGWVLAALESSGQAKDTLVIFTSDHGEMLGHKGFWAKSTMYDDAAKVPLIMTGPGVAPDGVRTDPVSLIDLAPTICETVTPGRPASSFSGRSLLAPAEPDRTVISEYHDGGCPVGITMLRWGPYKYVHYAQGHPPQLFDLSSDPDETRDMSADAPGLLAEGRARLAAVFDPEDADRRAHADQAVLIEKHGGRDALLAMEQWNFTPADSR
ncbi:MAG: sulfatase-like hydrolase/transferase [Pseudomonadota bacterium]